MVTRGLPVVGNWGRSVDGEEDRNTAAIIRWRSLASYAVVVNMANRLLLHSVRKSKEPHLSPITWVTFSSKVFCIWWPSPATNCQPMSAGYRVRGLDHGIWWVRHLRNFSFPSIFNLPVACGSSEKNRVSTNDHLHSGDTWDSWRPRRRQLEDRWNVEIIDLGILKTPIEDFSPEMMIIAV